MRIAIGLLSALACSVTSQTPAQGGARDIAITGVTIVDVAAGRTVPDQTVVIHGDHIASVGPRVQLPRNTLQVDGSGKFLIPGL